MSNATTSRRYKRWTLEEDQELLATYDGTGECARQLAKKFGRSRAGISARCQAHGLRVAWQPWEPDDIELLRREYGRCDIGDLAKRLGRSEMAVRVKAHQLGVKAQQAWAPEEDRAVLEAVPLRGYAQRLALQLNRTPSAIMQRRSSLLKRERQGQL
jgi:hypothetical protein